jgi:hypothetical protein
VPVREVRKGDGYSCAEHPEGRPGNCTRPLFALLAQALRPTRSSGQLQAEARRTLTPIPAWLRPDTPLFDEPDKLCKILNRDLRLAGIPCFAATLRAEDGQNTQRLSVFSAFLPADRSQSIAGLFIMKSVRPRNSP